MLNHNNPKCGKCGHTASNHRIDRNTHHYRAIWTEIGLLSKSSGYVGPHGFLLTTN